MFHSLQPLMQRLLRVTYFNSNLFPADDGACIYLWRYEMDTASCDFYACIEGLLNCVQAAEDGYVRSIAGCVCVAYAIIRQ